MKRISRVSIHSNAGPSFALLLSLLACSSSLHAQPVSCLSDEFNASTSIADWSRVEQAESWNTEPLATWDVDATVPGSMVMIPHTITWYRDYRGPLAFKSVSGDFAITIRVRATARDGISVPSSEFSLAGAMIRTPRAITPATWLPGQENYVFLSVGYGNAVPRRFQYEVKTTVQGDSILTLSNAPSSEAVLQLARLGPHVICLREDPVLGWRVHARYFRPDLPATLQVGLVAYTDWQKVSIFQAFVHNSNTLTNPLPPTVVDPNPFVPFNPDLRAAFDYARFASPVIPPALVGANLSNESAVTNGQLLSFLGGILNGPTTPCCACPADFDQSGGTPDAGDIDAFFTAWLAGVNSADVDCSGGTPDAGDIDAFFTAWLAGGC
jgi:hypothetical protein